jgi:hypothetical protein
MLVLSQTAAASHLCQRPGVVENGAISQTQSEHDHLGSQGVSADVDCPMVALAPKLNRHLDGICGMHCGDHAKGTQQAKAPEVPIHIELALWPADALAGSAIAPCSPPHAAAVRGSGKQRLHAFCRLLI